MRDTYLENLEHYENDEFSLSRVKTTCDLFVN